MSKDNIGVIIVIVLLVIGAFFFFNNQPSSSQQQKTTGIVMRAVPVDGNGKFTVTYSSQQSGKYVIVIVDEVSSNCHFANGESEYKTVIIGDGPSSQSVEVSGSSCVFSGDFDFFSNNTVQKLIKFGTQTVS